MDTRTSELIEQTLHQWDEYAAIEQEERLECVMAHVERQRARAAQRAAAIEAEAPVAGRGYTTSNAWQRLESRHE